MVNSEESIGTTEYLTLQTRCRINRCRYNRVQLYFQSSLGLPSCLYPLGFPTKTLYVFLLSHIHEAGHLSLLRRDRMPIHPSSLPQT